jgi:hypothetical protein
MDSDRVSDLTADAIPVRLVPIRRAFDSIFVFDIGSYLSKTNELLRSCSSAARPSPRPHRLQTEPGGIRVRVT